MKPPTGEKKAVFIAAGGAIYGQPDQGIRHANPWLQTIYGFMGLTDMMFMHADGLDFGGPGYREQGLTAATAQLTKIAQTW